MIKRLLLSIGVIVLFGMPVNLSAQTYEVPEILYYKFANNGPSNTPNYAIPGAGSNPANILGSLSIGPGGQFDSALVGSGSSSSTNYLDSGWEMDFGQGSWTISLWISNVPQGTFGYIFGNTFASSFRCFTAGGSGPTGIRLDGGSPFLEIDLAGVLPGPSVVHFVYDSVTTTLSGYVNGVLDTVVVEPPLNLTANVNFKVGGYGTSTGLAAGGLMDEFRVYRRALDSMEIANTWNQELPHTVTGIQNISTVASDYKLSQNYPNPFNPSTQIDFSIPEGGYTKLEIYNSLGQVVNTLVSRDLSAGSYTATFEGTGLSSGIYFYKLQSGEFSTVKKMNLIK